jgi:hypothetical protein
MQTPDLILGANPIAVRDLPVASLFTDAVAGVEREVGDRRSQRQYGQRSFTMRISHPLDAVVIRLPTGRPSI